MSKLHLTRFAPKRAAPFLVGFAALALALIPAAASQTGAPPYKDASGDNGSAGDITGISVASDKASGQIVFRIFGTNLSPSQTVPTFLLIDSDANPLTGDVGSVGADYAFGVDDTSFDFEHWNGSDWVQTPYSTVRITGSSAGLMISVNKSELGNSSEFNFWAESLDSANKTWDDAPDDGSFNYSIAANGPDIQGADVQTVRLPDRRRAQSSSSRRSR